MKKRLFHSVALLLALTLTACNNIDNDTKAISQQAENSSEAKSGEYAKIGSGAHLVKFPKDLHKGILYTTFDRGNIHENIYINSKEAIEAVQNGEEFPSDTVITLEGYEDGEIAQYLVMEKRTGWGSEYSPKERNGEWEYQAFTPNKEVRKDNIGRCFSCHAGAALEQYIHSLAAIKNYDLGKVSESNNSSTTDSIASIPTKDWKVSDISAHLNDSNSKDVNTKKASLLDDKEKAEVIEDVLLTIYLHQYQN
ncbi:cytochrome P460 family protein [Ectobacillus panaciterrae]|uniref:cytochrome P460 family protein n=1 Tax=Ectobacillus panaciterrae TaxID=363872 RepID=UPI000406E877|nr:cytochrome P460 family protein [Ectobacillus panaciterrae]